MYLSIAVSVRYACQPLPRACGAGRVAKCLHVCVQDRTNSIGWLVHKLYSEAAHTRRLRGEGLKIRGGGRRHASEIRGGNRQVRAG